MHTMLAPPHFGKKCLQWRSIATPLVELKKVLADYNTSSLLWRTRKQSDQKENRVDDAPQSIHGLRLHRICTESLTTVVVLGAIIGEMIRKQKHAQTATPLAAAAAADAVATTTTYTAMEQNLQNSSMHLESKCRRSVNPGKHLFNLLTILLLLT
jgi:hypothetical protein